MVMMPLLKMQKSSWKSRSPGSGYDICRRRQGSDTAKHTAENWINPFSRSPLGLQLCLCNGGSGDLLSRPYVPGQLVQEPAAFPYIYQYPGAAPFPREYFWAGIGDALSKEYEVLF